MHHRLLRRKSDYTWQVFSAAPHLLDRPLSKTVTDPSTNNVSTTNYLDDSIGNVKSVTVGGTGATSLTTSYVRNGYGDATSITDPAGNVTSYCYDGSTTCPNSSAIDLYGLPTAVTDALKHTSLFSYYPTTSLLQTRTDPNSQATTYTYDALGRPTKVSYPDKGSTTKTYVDTAPQSVTTTVAITSTLNGTSTSLLDGLGREYESELTTDPQGTDYTVTTYDPLERVASVSNPYRTTSDSTYGVTQYTYDELSRVTQVKKQDNSIVQTSYLGNTTTVTDEAGNPRYSAVDALGRLIEVEEPTLALTSPATPATGSYTIAGTEQSIQTAPATSGTGSLTFSGSEKSEQTGGTAGTGSVSITSVTCSGIEGGGYMTISVGGYTTSQASYTCSVSAASLATTLASSLNQSTLVSATASSNGANSGTVTITAKTTGSGTDYSLSVVNSTDGQNLGYTITPSGSTLTGGQNAQTTWDSGVFYVTVNGHQTPYSWSGTSPTNPTSANLATGMATAINQDASAYVNASSSGSVVSLTARTTGAATDYALSVSSYDATNLNSFSIADSGSALTGGTNAQYNYDTGTVSLTVGSSNVSVNYGSASTDNSVANALATALAGSPVTATVSGGTINVTTVQTGSSTNLPISATSATTNSSFSSPSFTASTSGSNLTGGSNAVYSPTFGTPLVTQYSYDAFGNLICAVQQGTSTTQFTTCAAASATWRPRAFTYDGLSRLLTASNPESGTITYSYLNSAGNVCAGDAAAVCQKTAPKPNQTGSSTVVTTYTYDVLNRLSGKSYNDGSTAAAEYGYDGTALTGCTTTPPSVTDSNPKLYRTSMCDGSGGTSWTHDQLGRILQERRTIGTVKGEYDNDVYNLDGSVSSLTALGQKVAYTYSGAGHPLTAVSGGVTYASGTNYAAPGQLLGLSTGTGITISNSYTNRLQPAVLSAATSSQTVYSRSYGFNYGTGDNGNVIQIVNNVNTARNQSFTYDILNRIVQGSSNGPAWGEAYTLDDWGNLTNRTLVSGKNNSEPFPAGATVNTANQLTSSNMGYDEAGNMTSDSGYTYFYDAENRITNTAGYTYVYDGDGKRVEKCVGSSCSGATSGQMYWYGTGSAASIETDLSGNLLHQYIFFGSQRIARYDTSTSTQHYYFSDELGSHDMVTNPTGTCEQDIDFYPYGGQENDYCSTPVAQNYKFTGKERDSESGLDMFGARYYGSSLGRFMTPDWAEKPIDVPYANFGNPQSLNLYSYVKNNPTTVGDPDGHCAEDACVIEGTAAIGAAVYVGGAALVAGTAAVLSTPSGQRSLSTFTSAASQSISDSISGIKSFFSKSESKPAPPNPNGSKGAPDHQATADEEAAKMGGDREVRVQTPEGEKGSRVIDAARTENGRVTEATQVIRPNKDGTPPAREVRAAADIQKATGVTPKLVPVRPIKPDGQ